MNDIGKPERETQNRVIALFRDELRYRYLGDWSDHPANSNIQEDLLTAHLARVGYTTAQINRAIFILRKEADNPNRSLYDNNKAVYSLLRYGVPINDAWESIPLACVDNVIALLDREIPLSHTNCFPSQNASGKRSIFWKRRMRATCYGCWTWGRRSAVAARRISTSSAWRLKRNSMRCSRMITTHGFSI